MVIQVKTTFRHIDMRSIYQVLCEEVFCAVTQPHMNPISTLCLEANQWFGTEGFYTGNRTDSLPHFML